MTTKPGRSAYEMLDRLGTDGGVRVLLVLASNIVVSAPHANRVMDRLNALDLLVVSDIFRSETAAMVDLRLDKSRQKLAKHLCRRLLVDVIDQRHRLLRLHFRLVMLRAGDGQ